MNTSSGSVPIIIVLTFITVMTGCTTHVEDWRKWTVDWDERFAEADRRGVDVPAAYTPAATDPPVLPPLEGDGPLELSVEQAVLLAVRHNRDLAVERLNPVVIGAFEQIERGVFDPELFAEANVFDVTGSETARATGERFSIKARETDAAAGVRQQLPSGTTVEAAISGARETSNRAPEQQEARLGLTVTQALLRGLGPAVNLARIRQAQLDTVASQYELRGFTEALLAEVETAYWLYVLAAEEIAILERSLEVARKQSGEIQRQVDVGALAEIDKAAPLAEVALREQALIDGRSNLEAQRLRLMRLMNPGMDGSLGRAITAVTPPRIDAQPIEDAEDRMALAEKTRPDLNEARVRLDERRLETIVTRNGVLPRLDVFIALGKTGYGATFGESFRELDSDTYDFGAGVRFSRVLGNRAAKARDRAAVASRVQAAAAVANLSQLVRLDVLLALNEVERARQQISASATTRQLQEKVTEAEKQRSDAGASPPLDFIRAQRDLLGAQIAEVEAVIRYRIALVSLYLAEGSLLDRRGIALGDNGR